MECKEIIDNLTHNGALYRTRAILYAISERITDPDVLEAISKLKKDKVMILGRPVYAYAVAALDILGAEKYTGDDPYALELVNGLVDFKFEKPLNLDIP